MAVALGANAGDRRAALAGAVVALAGMGEVAAASSLYASSAAELSPDASPADRAPYLNAVVRLDTVLPAEAVMAAMLAHEAQVGRDRAREGRHGARTLDMDLLVSDREVRQAPLVRLPHPRMAARPFVLVPLADAWPDAPHPTRAGWPRTAPGPQVEAVAPPAWAGAALAAAGALPTAGDDLVDESCRAAALADPPLYPFGQVGSTADVLRVLAAAGAPHGSVVVAERQAAGRGRHGRVWWAPAGGSLLVSILLRDGVDLGGLLPLLVGLCAVEAIEAAGGAALRLKWPNDVITGDGRKVGGILVERTGDMAALVGIGLNLAPLGADAPAEVLGRAASLADAGPAPPRALLLRCLAARLRELGEEARARGPATLLRRWRERAPMIGRPVRVHPAGGQPPYDGVADGVAADGALVVRRDDGSQVRVHAGDVSLSGSLAQR